jgi:hypothetical protein
MLKNNKSLRQQSTAIDNMVMNNEQSLRNSIEEQKKNKQIFDKLYTREKYSLFKMGIVLDLN